MKYAKFLSTIVIAVLMLVSVTALAASHGGKIRLYHLNSAIPGRGACIRMGPANLPGTGWACVWKSNPLYQEITDLLLKGYIHNKNCNITWNATDSAGHAIITIAECSN